jgi:hypothetical protein
MDLNTWYPAQTLEKWGCIKLLKELDQCLATPRRGGGRARSPRATSRSTTIASASSRSNSNHSRVRRLQRPQGQGRRAGGLHRGLPARDHPVRADQRPGPRVAGRSVWLITQNEESPTPTPRWRGSWPSARRATSAPRPSATRRATLSGRSTRPGRRCSPSAATP